MIQSLSHEGKEECNNFLLLAALELLSTNYLKFSVVRISIKCFGKTRSLIRDSFKIDPISKKRGIAIEGEYMQKRKKEKKFANVE